MPQALPKNHVVCAIDSQMTYGLAVLFSSLARTASTRFHVTVGYLAETLSPQDRRFLASLSDTLHLPLTFLPLPSNPLFITQGHISPTTFAKFLLADAIPEAHLWIDADAVALPGWDQVFESIHAATPKKGLVVAARGKDNDRPRSQEGEGLRFNAGVLGWPAGARRDWLTPLAVMEDVATQEQALFNQLYGDSAQTVSEAFNTLTYRLERLIPSQLPAIIHFAGAHKPWHLPRQLKHVCMEYRCPWAAWFDAEAELADMLTNNPLLEHLTHYQRLARKTGRFSWRRDHTGLRLAKTLALMGPLAPIAVRLLRLVAQWVPRGTHPLHPLKTSQRRSQ